MSVNTYERGQKFQLTEHFNITEFHCKGAKCGCTQTLHDPALSAYLQQIREHFGKPLHITSGYRCPKHNEAVGGTANSLHTKGMAADFVISGIKPLEIAQYAEQIGINGIGLYDNFVHIDTRENKFFWYGHQQEPRNTFGGVEATKFHVVSCRICGCEGVYTLLFDRAVGNYMQTIGNTTVAIKMELTDTDAVFSTVSIGREQAEILRVSELER